MAPLNPDSHRQKRKYEIQPPDGQKKKKYIKSRRGTWKLGKLFFENYFSRQFPVPVDQIWPEVKILRSLALTAFQFLIPTRYSADERLTE